jgi:hypothetical protein
MESHLWEGTWTESAVRILFISFTGETLSAMFCWHEMLVF